MNKSVCPLKLINTNNPHALGMECAENMCELFIDHTKDNFNYSSVGMDIPRNHCSLRKCRVCK